MATLVKGRHNVEWNIGYGIFSYQNILAVSYMNGELVLWDADTFETIDRVLLIHMDLPNECYIFSPNGERLVTTGGVDNSVVLFEIKRF